MQENWLSSSNWLHFDERVSDSEEGVPKVARNIGSASAIGSWRVGTSIHASLVLHALEKAEAFNYWVPRIRSSRSSENMVETRSDGPGVLPVVTIRHRRYLRKPENLIETRLAKTHGNRVLCRWILVEILILAGSDEGSSGNR